MSSPKNTADKLSESQYVSLFESYPALKQFKEVMSLSKKDLKYLSNNFFDEIQKGLKHDGSSSLAMLHSFVTKPTGREKGKFIALDIGGHNIRVEVVSLRGDSTIPKPQIKSFRIPNRLFYSTSSAFYDYITEKIKQSINPKEEYKLGFTFAFPMILEAKNRGVLLRLTKEFQISDLVGKNVVSPLEHYLEKKGMNVRVEALANDTVSTLATETYKDPNTSIGIILGTGTNGAIWLENKKTKTIEAFDMEWGNFDKFMVPKDIRSSYDIKLDKASSNKGGQSLEKMASGKYLGEIVRMVLEDFINRGIIFMDSKSLSMKNKLFLNIPYSISTEKLFHIASDSSSNLWGINSILVNMDISSSSLMERQLVKYLSKVVMERSAKITSAAILGTLKKIDPKISKRHTVAIDGSLYNRNSFYRGYLKNSLHNLIGPKSSNIKLTMSPDASGIGAAIIAATSSGKKTPEEMISKTPSKIDSSKKGGENSSK